VFFWGGGVEGLLMCWMTIWCSELPHHVCFNLLDSRVLRYLIIF